MSWRDVLVIGLLSSGCSTSAHYATQSSHREPVALAELRDALAGQPTLEPVSGVVESAPAPEVRVGVSVLSPAIVEFVEPGISEPEWTRATGGTWSRVVSERTTRIAALARNEQLQSAWQVRVSAQTRLSQSLGLRRLVDQVGSFTAPAETPSAGSLLPTPVAIEGQVAAADVEVEQTAFEMRAFELMEQVTRTFHRARFQARVVGVLVERLELARRLVAASRARFASNGSSSGDVAQAEMAEQEAALALTTARAARQALDRELGALLGSAEATSPGTARRLRHPPAVAAVRDAAAHRGLAVRAASARLARAQAMLAMAELETIPDRRSKAPMVEDAVSSMGSGLSYGVEAPWLAELRARVRALEHSLASARVSSPAAAQRAHARLTDSLRRVDLYQRQLLPRATRVLATLELQYATGRASYVELDDASNEWLRAGLGHHEALRDAAIVTAELETILGAPLSALSNKPHDPKPE